MEVSGQRGSIWRKWDLHVHVPHTRLNNQYAKVDGEVDLDRFCRVIHESTVSAIGLTDYFSLEGFFKVRDRYTELLDEGKLAGEPTVLFPNLELRLPESVNTSAELVDFHLIFPPSLRQEDAEEFLADLKTEITDDKGKPVSCSNLAEDQFLTATVTRSAIREAIDGTFGRDADRFDHVILIAPVNGNGVRADIGNHRKRLISDEIDKFSDGFFGNQSSLDHFLSDQRYDYPDQSSAPKPVFAGSDCHSFDELETYLGKEVRGTSNDKNITWIKAELTFAGLQQAFIEPAERVRMQSAEPDRKDPYMYISSVQFEGTNAFPDEILFNPNLNAIIGSRSSGKSALLAHIAHAVDADYAEKQQVASGIAEADLGPAAGYLWSRMGDLRCTVTWGNGIAKEGKVIYIPQNSLFSISTRPKEITNRIKPAVFHANPELHGTYTGALENMKTINSRISGLIDDWFDIDILESDFAQQLKELGDKKAVKALIAELEDEVTAIQKESNLTEEESEEYDSLAQILSGHESAKRESSEAQQKLAKYVAIKEEEVHPSELVSVEIDATPESGLMPETTRDEYDTLLHNIKRDALARVSQFVVDAWRMSSQNMSEADTSIRELHLENADLISKHNKAQGLALPLERLDKQRDILRRIETVEAELASKGANKLRVANSISDLIGERAETAHELVQHFNASAEGFDGINFVAEIGMVPEYLQTLARDFNRQSESPYMTPDRQSVDLDFVRRNCSQFLTDLASGKQRLKKSGTPKQIAHLLLEATEEIRFVAEMDEDRIGGFERSSMTPGKQALFALRLILGESDDAWPLLLDQPEDDLDSRSIYDVIVEELKVRKRERQIIMVTHDANLVIGADAEAVVVANRHGSDHPNANGQTFDYLTGALENSHRRNTEACALDRAGIREHACDILDGGEDAFQKRKRKYKI